MDMGQTPASPDGLKPEKRTPVTEFIARAVAIAGILWHLYALCFTATAPSILRPWHVMFILFLGFLIGPKPGKTRGTRAIVWILDAVFIAGVFASTIFIVFMDQQGFVMRAALFHNDTDIIFSIITTIFVLEMTRRMLGWPLVILALLSIAYAYFGDIIPPPFKIFSYDIDAIFGQLYGTGDGLFGMMVGICSTYILPFIFLGAIMDMCGTGNYFVRVASFFAGRSRGGPGKVAVISSALFGTISGAGAANVVATGTFTIPLMKRTGYEPRFACAVEAVASIGGQITPPVMASAAFLAADLMGIPYGQLITYAIIPAVLYYVSLYITLDLEAGRLKMKPSPAEDLGSGSELLKNVYLLIPLFIIIYELVIMNHSPLRAAVFAIIGGLVISQVNSGTRLAPLAYLRRVGQAFYNAAKILTPIGAAFICASIVVAMLNLTGLGIKFSSLILSAAKGHLVFALFLTMVITILLGMGLPVAASYVVAASVCAPSLVQLGIPLVAAHMFILHFASLSGITPPVALCAYAAAGIGEEKPLPVAVTACRIGLCAFFVPYAFALGPSLLLLNGFGSAMLAIIPALAGAIAVVMCVIGWIIYPIPWYLRMTLLFGGLCMLYVGLVSDLVGFAVMAVSLAAHFLLARHTNGFLL
ncbi:MAG: TRAP transporter fused permease subunit [Synergistaceae bacterium]|jgi:TRAP transporter 4TM/12TM fusion protein|nr:TRAP transporter fused permease subunit [Synergistaceae bacterium]